MVIVSVVVRDFGSHMLQKISELENKSNIKLPVTKKILLAETGTVEQILSILTNSETIVNVRKQTEDLELILRDVIITNKKTGETLANARSRFFLANIPGDIINQIKRKNIGIGNIIIEHELETFRKIIKIGFNSKSNSIFRVYQIIHHGKVAIEIKECFTSNIDLNVNLALEAKKCSRQY
jgi:chorismate-pyruvate lyase